MSCKNVKSSNAITKKCGEIIITLKKNSKHVYSFNCWFCGSIYVQIKKFTLHLEKEHVTQLEQTTSIVSEHSNENNLNDKTEILIDTAMHSIYIGEIKIEDRDNDGIKSEIGEEKPQIVTRSLKKSQLSPKFQDPLETFKSNANEISLPVAQENDEKFTFTADENINFKNEPPTLEDVEINNFSEDEQLDDSLDFSGEDNTIDSDFNIKNSDDEKLMSKQLKKPKEKEYTLALIEAYYKKSQLWNISASKKCSPKKRKILLQKLASLSITDELNVRLKTKLKPCTVNDKLNLICKQYEKEIKRQLNNKEKNNDTDSSQLWFYKNLSFLKSTIENKLKLKKKKTYHKVKPLTDDFLHELIDIYKNYNSLWNINHVAYPVKEIRNETIQSMVKDVNRKIDIPLDVDNLEKHLQYIHKSFSKDKQHRMECETKQLDFQPTFSFFNKCNFLEDHQGPFKCSYCSEIFIPFKDFQIHKSQHDGSIPFKCEECGSGFKAHGNYTIHVKRHLGVLRFRCEICDKGYPVNSELENHMRTHSGDQPYLCSICGEGFRTAVGYDNHVRRHEERFRYYCHICKKGFNALICLNDHVNAHLNVRNFICPVCGKSFTCKKYLNYHRRIHGSKNYTCNICGKSYAQDAGLRQHKKQHGTPIGVISTKKEKNKYKTTGN